MVYQYEWRVPIYKSVSAQEAGEFIEKMGENGNVTAKSVVDAARDETSVIHPCFEWDDTKAAEKYRLKQAGTLLGNIIRVEVKTHGGEKAASPVRAFVNVSDNNFTGVYKPIEVAMRNVIEREQVLANAKREALEFMQKYESLEEFASVFAEIRKVV